MSTTIKLKGRVDVKRLEGKINLVPSASSGGPLQAKTVYPSHSEQAIAPDEDYYGLAVVTVKPVPRVPACEVSVKEAESEVIENVVNISVESFVDEEPYISFTSACYDVNGNTQLTGTIEVNAGDWILATVTTRSETTFPEGWTVLRESTVLNADANNQRMFFLCKQATETGTESVTIVQSESARIYINLLASSDINGFVYHEGTEVYSDTVKATSITVERPDCKKLVWGCTANLWSSSAPYGTWECSGLTAICLDQASNQTRQANFVDQTQSGEMIFVPNAETFYIIDCVEILY